MTCVYLACEHTACCPPCTSFQLSGIAPFPLPSSPSEAALLWCCGMFVVIFHPPFLLTSLLQAMKRLLSVSTSQTLLLTLPQVPAPVQLWSLACVAVPVPAAGSGGECTCYKEQAESGVAAAALHSLSLFTAAGCSQSCCTEGSGSRAPEAQPRRPAQQEGAVCCPAQPTRVSILALSA